MVLDKRASTVSDDRHRVSFNSQLILSLTKVSFVARSAAAIEYNLRAGNDTEKPNVAQLNSLLSLKLKNVVADNPHELCSAFFVYTVGAKLFDANRKAPSNVLHCLSGLRTIAMLHIMLSQRSEGVIGFCKCKLEHLCPRWKLHENLFLRIYRSSSHRRELGFHRGWIT